MFNRPDQQSKRSLLICYLRDIRAWGEEPLAELFGPTDASQLLAEVDRLDHRWRDSLGAELTPREVASMRNDYRRDPYMTPRERRQALRWLAARWPTARAARPSRHSWGDAGAG